MEARVALAMECRARRGSGGGLRRVKKNLSCHVTMVMSMVKVMYNSYAEVDSPRCSWDSKAPAQPQISF